MTENLLRRETSPYLLQHKDNPVHWRAWGPEAIEAARRTDKPILLSVGYAACHWCHVMAHESFEDPETAALMNELFVNIKVDREERPDIDRIYMEALHRLGEHGGWPLTMFLTRDGEPFWGGTYFPKEPRYGRPSFRQVLREVARLYRQEFHKVEANRDALRAALLQAPAAPGTAELTPDILDRAASQLLGLIDLAHGGIQGAPKFPQAALFALLWRAWLRTGDVRFHDAVTLTLARICQGGIYDHLGGGFARYAVDHRWLVPHFEKMLYDNAQLVELLTLVWQDTGAELYRQRVEETVGWLQREMLTAEGAFAASLDADSEGEEGRFYVWSAQEIAEHLPPDLAEPFARFYDVTPGGNWEGRVILNRIAHPDLADAETEAKLAEARRRLLAAREARPRPGWDDKALADWNGLMIAALANAGAAFERRDWIDLAETAFQAVLARLWRDDHLMHAFRLGLVRHFATADGYANLTRAAIVLYEITGTRTYLDNARRLAAEMRQYYWDGEAGGYFFTSIRANDLIVRQKTAHDDATPNGNATMLGNLARLHALTGEAAYRADAEALSKAFAAPVLANIFSHTSLLNAFEDLADGVQFVLAGDPRSAAFAGLARAVFRRSVPTRSLLHTGEESSLPPSHPAHGKSAPAGGAALYLCRGTRCSLPITEADALPAALAAFRR